jgi:putative endonuclease
VGKLGESLAAWYLEEHGITVVGRNHRTRRGEVDLLAVDGSQRVAVEVRSRVDGEDPVDAIDPGKRARVKALAASIGADRVDLVGVRLRPTGFDIHWVPGT